MDKPTNRNKREPDQQKLEPNIIGKQRLHSSQVTFGLFVFCLLSVLFSFSPPLLFEATRYTGSPYQTFLSLSSFNIISGSLWPLLLFLDFTLFIFSFYLEYILFGYEIIIFFNVCLLMFFLFKKFWVFYCFLFYQAL